MFPLSCCPRHFAGTRERCHFGLFAEGALRAFLLCVMTYETSKLNRTETGSPVEEDWIQAKFLCLSALMVGILMMGLFRSAESFLQCQTILVVVPFLMYSFLVVAFLALGFGLFQSVIIYMYIYSALREHPTTALIIEPGCKSGDHDRETLYSPSTALFIETWNTFDDD